MSKETFSRVNLELPPSASVATEKDAVTSNSAMMSSTFELIVSVPFHLAVPGLRSIWSYFRVTSSPTLDMKGPLDKNITFLSLKFISVLDSC